MSPELTLALLRRGIDPTGPAPAHAHRSAAPDSRCAVTRIRSSCDRFRSTAAAPAPRAGLLARFRQRLRALITTPRGARS